MDSQKPLDTSICDGESKQVDDEANVMTEAAVEKNVQGANGTMFPNDVKSGQYERGLHDSEAWRVCSMSATAAVLTTRDCVGGFD